MPTATRTYLELRDPAQLKVPEWFSGLRVSSVVKCAPAFFRWLYQEVGRQYHWVDRLQWTDEQIREYLDAGDVHLFVLYVDGQPAGYFELRDEVNGSVEIAYFGLMPAFIGKGYGKALLITAAREAFSGGAGRVWLHTCTLDHPAALPNYLACGFRPFKTEEYEVPI